MSDVEDLITEQVKRDADHFRSLLDLIPPQHYFSLEEKDEIWGNDDDSGFRKKKKEKLSQFTISEIAELQQKGQTVEDLKKQRSAKKTVDSEEESQTASTKHEGKKHSRNVKNKQKAKELQRREARLEELKVRLQAKVQELKARKSAGQTVTSQEQKRLKRQEKKINAKLKNKPKNKTNKGEVGGNKLAEGLRSPPQNKILNSNGVPVKSKFDFSVISFGDESGKSDLTGRDYRRLLEKVERRKEKVEKLKEKDAEAGKRLETKIQWQTVMSKAQGEKVKDDPKLLNKAAKRKDKIKDRKKKKWDDRAKNVKEQQKKKQDKREANIEKRKTDKKDKKRKKLIKKGRIIPGF